MDGGVLGAVLGLLAVEEEAVGGVGAGDVGRIDEVDVLDTVFGLDSLQLALLEPEGVVGEAYGADVEGGGVVGGAHELEDGVDVGAVELQEFVEDERGISLLAAQEDARTAVTLREICALA